jgi:hypothetical protein
MPLQIDIARSHLETLIERLTDAPRAVPDGDGDYVLTAGGASFMARVDGLDRPVIRVFSIVAAEVDGSPDLFEALNEINSRLTFLRIMWVRGQIMMESEMLAFTADMADFYEVCSRIGSASDHFGPTLLERFGGRSPYAESKAPDYSTSQPQIMGYL